MKNGKIIAGVDSGHIHTKAVIIRGRDILGYATADTGFNVVRAADAALKGAVKNAAISESKLIGVVSTGIYKETVNLPSLHITARIAEYVADARGAFFLNEKSRTMIDIGGNIHKAVHYDHRGVLLDVIQNDKCADGLGIFYTSMAKLMGLSEEKLSELALKSTGHVSLAIQCALSAESDAIDLISQGTAAADVADAISKFIAERVAAMSTYMPLTKEIVIAGGLAKSPAVVKHLSNLIKREVSVPDLPEYVGAIGAAMSYEGGK